MSDAVREVSLREPRVEKLYYDEKTLNIVYYCLRKKLTPKQATEIINSMQDKGILFRERP